MKKEIAFPGIRENVIVMLQSDLVIVGGGLAGTCAAITAARNGIKVVLVQDRPVLGGNGSSEVRLWILGATSHMGNNNRWSREGGVVDEILVENLFRNKEGNAIIFDTILLEKVKEEKNITLLLNTLALEINFKSDLCCRLLYEVAYGCCHTGGNDVIRGLILLHDKIHCLDIVLGMTPVALSRQVTHKQLFLNPHCDATDGTGHLSCQECFTPDGRFVIE